MQIPTNFSQKQIIILGGGVVVVLVIAIVILFFGFRTHSNGAGAATLTIWGTDSQQAFNDIVSTYNGPGSGAGAQIKYVQIDPAGYRTKLLAALAAGTGPDIFEISSRDLPQWQSVMAPVPAALAQTFNPMTLEGDFPDVVSKDFVSNGNIYALPLSLDTLAMIYNKDLFNTAGIATIPSTWDALQTDLPLLRQVNAQGQVSQAALALGGSETSIHNASDIVFLLMMQNGASLNGGDGTSVAFASNGNDQSALNAFDYYLQFSNSANTNYTWNDALGNSLDAFAQGKVAAIFDYASAIPVIKAKSPFLNYGVAAMPQPSGASSAINYAQYMGLGVSRNSANIAGAWSFIIGLTTNPTDANIYLKDTGEPPALRSMIQSDLTDPAMGVFARQALTARSWYEANSGEYDAAMNMAIANVLNGAATPSDALQEAETTMDAAGQ